MTLLNVKLLFDSDATGGQMGARSLVGNDRSLLFSAGPMVVDVVVYRGGDDMRVVHGQIVDREKEAPIAGAEVTLGSSAESVQTDEFGQFHLSTLLPFSQSILSIRAEQGEMRCAIPARAEAEEVAR